MSKFPRTVSLALLGGLAALAVPDAQAQQGAAATGRSEVITVTAQRRAADLQEVPAAVTALNAAALENNQVADVLDLQYQVPNINLGTNTGTANAARLFLRGVGEDESRGAVDPAIGIYVDGVYVGRAVGALFDLVDLERVEVLRGPQGTLYGRNSNGGAIKLISVAPQFDNSAEGKLTVGNYDRRDLKGTVNVKLTDDTALRVSGLYRTRDGFFDLNPNGDLANLRREVGEQDVKAFRLSLLHNFTADWSARFTLDNTQDNSDPIPDSAAPPNDRDRDVFTVEPLPGVTCSSATPLLSRPIGCFNNYNSGVRTQGVSLNVTGKLGNLDFTSLTGYRTLNDKLQTRVGSVFYQKTDQNQVSQEFTLASNYDGAFNWVGGLYYFREDVLLDTIFVFPFTIDTDTKSYAGFIQGTYDITPKLKATGGVRYTNETKDFFGINRTSARSVRDSQDFNTTSYRAGLDYQFSENLMVYGFYANGFKGGGWSPDCFSATACFLRVQEEEVRSFEAGLRSDLFGGLLRFNATGFFNTYEGLQIGATVPGVGFTRFNVDETQIQGAEFEASIFPTERLEISANLGLLDAEYTEVTLAQAGGLSNVGAGCPGGVVTIACAKNLELKNAPEYKGQVAAAYTIPIFNGDLRLSGDVSFEDDSWSLVANSPPHALSDIPTLYNARIAFTPANANWNVAIWGQNLSDEEYWRAASAGSFTTYASPPLTWGVDIGVKF